MACKADAVIPHPVSGLTLAELIRYSKPVDTTTPEALLTALTHHLRARLPGLLAIYRFGSFGTDQERANSDIDLGLQADGPLDPVALFDIAGELATFARREVDLVDMIRCSTVMRAQIVATGERIFCRDRARCESFADSAFSAYAYLNEARRELLNDFRSRGSLHAG